MIALRARLPLIGGAAAALVIAGWSYRSMYAVPRTATRNDIEATRQSVERLESELKNRDEVRARAKASGSSLLSDKFDALEHLFRAGLGRVAEQEGLTGVVVQNGPAQDQLNQPVLSAKGMQTSLKRELRREPDFSVVRGSIKGSGTLEQVLRTVGAVQAQPWVHRVEGLSIKPVGKERERFELRVEVATLFAPGMAPKGGGAAEIVPATPESETLWRAVLAKNVFREPAPGRNNAPETVRVARPAGAAVPAQVFAPYEDWKLTGIVSTSRGTEAFFLNTRTGARVTVPKGGVVLDAVFVDGNGEQAIVEIAGKRFELYNGQTLAARRPLG